MTGILQQIMSTMEQTRSVSVLDSVSMIGFAALLVLGVINCVLGYRLLRFWMMLFGFLIGGGIGLGVAYTMGIQEKYMYAVIMIGVGILLAVIAFLSYKVGIFIIGAGIGLGLGIYVFHPTTSLIFFFCLLLGVGLGVLAMKWAGDCPDRWNQPAGRRHGRFFLGETWRTCRYSVWTWLERGLCPSWYADPVCDKPP